MLTPLQSQLKKVSPVFISIGNYHLKLKFESFTLVLILKPNLLITTATRTHMSNLIFMDLYTSQSDVIADKLSVTPLVSELPLMLSVSVLTTLTIRRIK